MDIDEAKFEVIFRDLHGRIFGAMESWLAGEPVWPHARILKDWGPQFEMYRLSWSRNHFEDEFSVENIMAASQLRDDWIGRYGFPIPCAELLDALRAAQPIVEVGAGSGFMTRLMRAQGIDVIGSDPRLDYGHVITHGQHDAQQVIAQAKTMIRRHRDRSVFCAWPSYDQFWFRQALKAMQIGQRMIVIREDACAEDTAWHYFDVCFDEERTVYIPAWRNLNDYCDIRIKKRQRDRS
jgi:hypothetical protein